MGSVRALEHKKEKVPEDLKNSSCSEKKQGLVYYPRVTEADEHFSGIKICHSYSDFKVTVKSIVHICHYHVLSI